MPNIFGSSIKQTADRGFNLNEFMSEAVNPNGLMSPNLFVVEVSLDNNPELTEQNETLRKMPFFCQAAALPGLTLASSDTRTLGYGMLDRTPTAAIAPDVTLSFMLDSDGQILKFFQNWMQNIINFDPTHPSAATGASEILTYEVNYKENFFSTITIFTFDKTGDTIHEYKLHEAFPMAMSDVELSWSTTDAISTLNVTFHQTSFTTNSMIPTFPKEIDRSASPFALAARVLAGGLSTIPTSLFRGNLSTQDIINTSANVLFRGRNLF